MRRIHVLALALAMVAAGCGRGRAPQDQPLRLEELADTTGIALGTPLIRTFEPYRVGNGVLRVRGKVDFPDGTRLQVSILEPASGRLVKRFQVLVQNGRFDSPPLIGPTGSLAQADYHFEVLAHFNDAWQPPEVLQRTGDGRSLRGPGMTRGVHGEAVFRLVEDAHI